MWTTFSVSRWICLLTLAVVMLSFASEGQFRQFPCCLGGHGKRYKPKEKDVKCFQQEPSRTCNTYAFIIVTNKGMACLKSDNQWLKNMRKQGEINCTPLINKSKRRFEDLDENDVE